MLITKEDAIKMNQVLAYMVKNEQARVKLKQIMDILSTSLEDARFLYESIMKYHHDVEPVISIHFASNMGSRPRVTDKFLEKGGFLRVYEQQAKIRAFKEFKSGSKNKKLRIQIQILKYFWLFIAMIIASFILSLVAVILALHK